MTIDEENKEYLLKALENENNESIIELSIQEIKSQKNDILQKLNLSREMLKALICSLSFYPVGQIVLLNNGFIGKVIRTYKDNPKAPDVQLFFDPSGKKLEEPRVIKLKEKPILFIDKCEFHTLIKKGKI